MEAANTSETSVNFYQTTQHNIPGNSHLKILNSLSENLSSMSTAFIDYEKAFDRIG
jgi:hypothetical protein